jgi:hypothetical protein
LGISLKGIEESPRDKTDSTYIAPVPIENKNIPVRNVLLEDQDCRDSVAVKIITNENVTKED